MCRVWSRCCGWSTRWHKPTRRWRTTMPLTQATISRRRGSSRARSTAGTKPCRSWRCRRCWRSARANRRTALLVEALSRAEAGGLVRVFADTLPEVVEPRPAIRAQWRSCPGVARLHRPGAGGSERHRRRSDQDRRRWRAAPYSRPRKTRCCNCWPAGLPNKRIATELGSERRDREMAHEEAVRQARRRQP